MGAKLRDALDLILDGFALDVRAGLALVERHLSGKKYEKQYLRQISPVVLPHFPKKKESS